MTESYTPPALLPAVIKRPSLPDEYAVNRKYQGIPSITALPDSRTLFVVWYTGGTGEGPENHCVIARSTDGGNSWEDPFFVIRHNDPNVRCFDPNIWCDPDGRLWVFWTQSFSQRTGNIYDGRGGVWASFCLAPNEEEPSWSPPGRIANGVMLNKPILLSNGEWAFPTALWNDLLIHGAMPTHRELRNEMFSNITISPDRGKTFFRRGGADVPERSFDENMVVEKKDGSLWMLVRTDYGIGQSFSTDMGKTWSPGGKTPIASPNSRFYIGRLASGNLLLIHNVDDSNLDYKQYPWRKRHKLTARISLDDGRTWEEKGLILEEEEGATYPDAFQAADGSIYITYDFQRYKGGFIYMAKVTEEDILAGKPVTESSCLKRIVSSYPCEEKEIDHHTLTPLEEKIREDEPFTLIPPEILPVTDPSFYPENSDFIQSGGFERTPNGRLWITWVGGGDNEHAFLLCAYSDDEGKSWTHPLYMIPNKVSPNGFLKSHCCGVFWTDPSGRLWWIFDCRLGSFDGRSGTWCSICENPDSDTPSFGTPFRIWHGVSLNRPQELSDGTWAMFISLWPRHRIYGFSGQTWSYDRYDGNYTKELDPERKCWMFTSSDQGKTWQRRGGVKAAQREFDEPSFIERKDGSFLMYTRTYYGLAESESFDKGYTWTEPKPSSISHPPARLFLCRLQSGKLLMVRHERKPGDPPVRNNLTAYLSRDEGKTWYGGLRFEDRSGVSYPDGFQHPDGRIFIQYDRKRIDGSLQMSIFTEEDVAAGRIVSEKALLSSPLMKCRRYDEINGK